MRPRACNVFPRQVILPTSHCRLTCDPFESVSLVSIDWLMASPPWSFSLHRPSSSCGLCRRVAHACRMLVTVRRRAAALSHGVRYSPKPPLSHSPSSSSIASTTINSASQTPLPACPPSPLLSSQLFCVHKLGDCSVAQVICFFCSKSTHANAAIVSRLFRSLNCTLPPLHLLLFLLLFLLLLLLFSSSSFSTLFLMYTLSCGLFCANLFHRFLLFPPLLPPLFFFLPFVPSCCVSRSIHSLLFSSCAVAVAAQLDGLL